MSSPQVRRQMGCDGGRALALDSLDNLGRSVGEIVGGGDGKTGGGQDILALLHICALKPHHEGNG